MFLVIVHEENPNVDEYLAAEALADSLINDPATVFGDHVPVYVRSTDENGE